MNWKVKFKYRYSTLNFVFETLDDAGEFVKTTLTHYESDEDGEGIFLSILPVSDKEEDED